MLNTYTPPLMLCGTQYRTVECGPPLGCAEWEAGVGTVRVRMTFFGCLIRFLVILLVMLVTSD